jgi:Xaa-Pro dipeptidase
VRRQRLHGLMEERSVEAVLLRRPENFAWYTGGGNSRVEYVSPLGVADAVITFEEEWVLTSTIEAARMRREETPAFEVVEYPWEQGPEIALRELVGDMTLAADIPLPGALDLSEEVAALRRILDPGAVEQLRSIGADLTAALAEAADTVEPGVTERDAAADIAASCRSRGLVATVLLAATNARIARYRHPLPTEAPIERRAMLVASAERGGLYANLTRIVEFDEPEPEIARHQAACDEILVRMRDEATRPGRSLADAFADCRRFYGEAGFPDEWRLHHQGGMTGYASREVLATPYTDVPIETGQAFAWNPSVTGAKAEETFVLTDAGPEVVAARSLPVTPDRLVALPAYTPK